MNLAPPPSASEVDRPVPDTRAASEGLRADDAYARIRHDILSCRLLPSAMVTEPDLMQRYGVGKNSCRHALIRLVQEGYVRSIPRQGYRVAGITLKDVEEVFALRIELEPMAARLAAGKVDIDLLRRLEAECRVKHPVLDLTSQIGVFLDANKSFHLAIAAATGNDRLFKVLSGLLDEMSRLVAMGFGVQGAKPEIKNDHNAMIDAFVAGDGRRAEQIARRHILTFQSMTMEKVYASLSRSGALLPVFSEARNQ